MKNQIVADEIIEQLNHDQIVTIPTETVYGYAVSLNSKLAIENLMKLKDRDYDSGKVFTLVPTDKATLDQYAIIPDFARPLIDRYIPGEITLIFKKNPNFHHFYYDHFGTIGVRIPDHPLFAKILSATGPLLLTSANLRGGTPKSTTGHLPSTIVDCTSATPKILRQGNLIVKL